MKRLTEGEHQTSDDLCCDADERKTRGTQKA